jgi:hypothetical protein
MNRILATPVSTLDVPRDDLHALKYVTSVELEENLWVNIYVAPYTGTELIHGVYYTHFDGYSSIVGIYDPREFWENEVINKIRTHISKHKKLIRDTPSKECPMGSPFQLRVKQIEHPEVKRDLDMHIASKNLLSIVCRRLRVIIDKVCQVADLIDDIQPKKNKIRVSFYRKAESGKFKCISAQEATLQAVLLLAKLVTSRLGLLDIADQGRDELASNFQRLKQAYTGSTDPVYGKPGELGSLQEAITLRKSLKIDAHLIQNGLSERIGTKACSQPIDNSRITLLNYHLFTQRNAAFQRLYAAGSVTEKEAKELVSLIEKRSAEIGKLYGQVKRPRLELHDDGSMTCHACEFTWDGNAQHHCSS